MQPVVPQQVLLLAVEARSVDSKGLMAQGYHLCKIPGHGVLLHLLHLKQQEAALLRLLLTV